jgi:ATP synthase protein I
MANPNAGQILRLQAKLILAAVVVSLILGWGRFDIAVSTLLGGLSVLIPTWAYGRIAFARRHIPPAYLMRAHFRGEAVKFLLTVAIFGCVLVYDKNLSVAGLFGGYLAAVSSYWFGLLIK